MAGSDQSSTAMYENVQSMQSKLSSSSVSLSSTPGQNDSVPDSITSQSSAEDLLDLKSVNEKILADSTVGLEMENVKEEGLGFKKSKMIDTYGNEFELPDFSFKQVREAIPSHCFKRSAVKSLGYVARDIFQWSALFWLFKTYNTEQYVSSDMLRGLLWFVYTVFAGFVGTGLWVLAHECGHGAFSDSKRLNDVVGFILHSSLGAPYFSWQITHRKHHQNTGNLDRDMVFVPSTREQYSSKRGKAFHEVSELAEDTPIWTALTLIGQQLIGWNLYLCNNTTGHNKHENAPDGRGKGKKNGPFNGVNHFQPMSPLFDKKDMPLIYLSDLGLITVAIVLTMIARTYGAWNMFVWYGAPYLWVNNWLGKSHRKMSSSCSFGIALLIF